MPSVRFTGMRIDGGVVMIALEREQSLRIAPGVRVEIDCAAGVLWITQEGDVRDLFLARGESLTLTPRGAAIVTALEPARIGLTDLRRNRLTASPLRAALLRCVQLGRRLVGALRPAPAIPASLSVRR
jgi:hypothetical protein